LTLKRRLKRNLVVPTPSQAGLGDDIDLKCWVGPKPSFALVFKPELQLLPLGRGRSRLSAIALE
jgi:hypothetical protein